MNKGILISLVLLAGISANRQQPTAEQIYDRMRKAYTTAQTYQDAGTVTTWYTDKGDKEPNHTTSLNFETAFVRSANRFKFRYEQSKSVMFTNRKTCYLVVSDGKSTRMLKSQHKDRSATHEPSLGAALTAISEGSGTAARKIPGMLLSEPIKASWDPKKLQSVKLIGKATQDGQPCYQLEAVVWGKKKAQLWIDQQTYLIRRIDEDYQSPTVSTRTSITYQPAVNKSVKDEALAFKEEYCD
ncbi:hypothetical protein GCM10023187_07330 [Nibrella viscosa]|uniref:Outer membrane lipoprotein-sorting protein n=1 Tax=Nibrella viscosa TaxID=1084524 RepID=A0ABP8JXW7_9BACT